MNRPSLIALCALLGACSSAVLTDIKPEVVASPPVLDLGTIQLGTETIGRVGLSVRNGVGNVLDVNLLPTLGEGFAYEGSGGFAIDADASNGFDLTFRPTAAGYASALVQITTDGKVKVLEVAVRARAVEADLLATPSVIDLGVVPSGTTASDVIHLENLGALDVELSGAVPSAAGLTVDATFPRSLAASDGGDVPISYTAPSDAPMLGNISFTTGTATVSNVVIVRANSCEQGLPASYDVDEDGVTSCGGDCDDHDADVGPGQPERVNGLDDDCDRLVDEGTTADDVDGDGYCADPTACVGAALPGDCQDGDATIAPGATEIDDNGVDDNCDGVIDLGSVDGDHDGYGPTGGDCNDADPTRHPGAPETVNGLDDDCDHLIDEGTTVSDDDGDGYCESLTACVDGTLPGDCADNDVRRAPNLIETPDYMDNDCDGRIDNGTDRADDDGDGFTELGGDCNDTDPAVSPAFRNCP